MRITELIRLLEDLEAEHGDVEVRLQTQQSWPFINSIRGVTDSAELAAHGRDGDGEPAADDACADAKAEPVVVYIVEGGQLSYGDRAAWDLV